MVYFCVLVHFGRVVSVYTTEPGQGRTEIRTELEVIDGMINLGNNSNSHSDKVPTVYKLSGEGVSLEITIESNSDNPATNTYKLSEGLNVFPDGHGAPTVFWHYEVFHGMLKAVGLPTALLATHHHGCEEYNNFFEFDWVRKQSQVNILEVSGQVRSITIGIAAQISDFVTALQVLLSCFLDEIFLNLLQRDNSDENLYELMNWLRDQAKLTYVRLSEKECEWIISSEGVEKPYRPWASRRNLASLYPLHLVCKKYGLRKVFQLLRGGEGPITKDEEQVLSNYEAHGSWEAAVAYLLGRYSVQAVERPLMRACFSFDNKDFAYPDELEGQPFPIGPLFRRHEGLGAHLLASLPISQVYQGLTLYPNHLKADTTGGIAYFVDGEERTPAFLSSELLLLPANLSRLPQYLVSASVVSPMDALGIGVRVESVVNAVNYGRGHVLQSGEIVLRSSFEGSTKYLLLISQEFGHGGVRTHGLCEIKVSGKKNDYLLGVARHKGPYEILHGAVVVKQR